MKLTELVEQATQAMRNPSTGELLNPTFLVGDSYNIDKTLDNVTTLPCVLYMQPVTGSYAIRGASVVRLSDVIIAVAVEREHVDEGGESVNDQEELLHPLVIELLRRISAIPELSVPGSVRWQFTTGKYDRGMSVVAMSFTLEYTVNASIC